MATLIDILKFLLNSPSNTEMNFVITNFAFDKFGCTEAGNPHSCPVGRSAGVFEKPALL